MKDKILFDHNIFTICTITFDYLYNGKERFDDFDLGWDNFGFRFYDPAIGRFTGVDPISDQFPHVSTY